MAKVSGKMSLLSYLDKEQRFVLVILLWITCNGLAKELQPNLKKYEEKKFGQLTIPSTPTLDPGQENSKKQKAACKQMNAANTLMKNQMVKPWWI